MYCLGGGSAGVNTPQAYDLNSRIIILKIAGIGPRAVLDRVGIAMKINAPGDERNEINERETIERKREKNERRSERKIRGR
jgi:hypothetical protein